MTDIDLAAIVQRDAADYERLGQGTFWSQLRIDRRALLRLGSALLTEYHGTMGCDPNCEKNYHAAFNGNLTADEYTAIVGPSLTTEEWDARLETRDSGNE